MINNFIRYEDLFKHLIEKNSSAMLDDYDESCSKSVYWFSEDKQDMTLILDECEMNEREIIWVYGKEFNDANESDTQGSWSSVFIVYDIANKYFSDFQQDNG